MPARDRRIPFWSKWVWKDWYASTADLSPEARGAHMDLMAYAATQSADRCSIPDDDRVLAYAARMRLERWRKVRAQVLSHWTADTNSCRYQQSRLAVDASEYDNYRGSNDVGSTERVKPDPFLPRNGRTVRSKKLEVDLEAKIESTPPARSRRAAAPRSGRIPATGYPSLPTNTGEEWAATQQEVDAWAQAYNGLDIPGTMQEAKAWLIANPTRRKTFNGMARYVNGWLAREQNRL